MGDGPQSKSPNPELNPPETMRHAGLRAFSHGASKAEDALLQAEATKVGKAHPASEIS